MEVGEGELQECNTPVFSCREVLLKDEGPSTGLVPLKKGAEESEEKFPLDEPPTPEGSSGESKEERTQRVGRRTGLKEEAVRSAAACSAGGALLGARKRAHPRASKRVKVAERRDGKKGTVGELELCCRSSCTLELTPLPMVCVIATGVRRGVGASVEGSEKGGTQSAKAPIAEAAGGKSVGAAE